MRTPLAWTLRVTISPWNSGPDFLKVPMLAMSLLLCCSSPRPSRPRWRSAGRRRSTTHPSSGRSAAEDGGGEAFLLREEWAKPRGRKSHRRRCGIGDRGAAVLWPDQAIRGHVARAGPTALRRRRGGYRATRTRGRPHRAKEKKPLRADGRHCMSRHPAAQGRMANRVAPDEADASIRSKHCDEPRYGHALAIRNRLQPRH